MYNIVQEYLYFHGTRKQKVLLIVTVGGGIWSKGDTILFQDFLFKHPFWMIYSYFPVSPAVELRLRKKRAQTR